MSCWAAHELFYCVRESICGARQSSSAGALFAARGAAPGTERAPTFLTQFRLTEQKILWYESTNSEPASAIILGKILQWETFSTHSLVCKRANYIMLEFLNHFGNEIKSHHCLHNFSPWCTAGSPRHMTNLPASMLLWVLRLSIMSMHRTQFIFHPFFLLKCTVVCKGSLVYKFQRNNLSNPHVFLDF